MGRGLYPYRLLRQAWPLLRGRHSGRCCAQLGLPVAYWINPSTCAVVGRGGVVLRAVDATERSVRPAAPSAARLPLGEERDDLLREPVHRLLVIGHPQEAQDEVVEPGGDLLLQR